jgi:peptidyl-Asp metalloendopeptidase
MKSLIFVLSVVFTFCFATNFTFAQSGAKLFNLRETPSAKIEKSSIASVRESEISFNSLSFRNTETLEMPLFDGKNYSAKHFQTETRATDDYTWRGKLSEGKFEGDVILTFKKGYVAGIIYAPLNQVYEIVPKFDKQILIELNQNLFPECAGDVKGEDSKPKAENAIAMTDSGDRIDVLVLYTTPVKTTLGGDAQAQTLAQSAIDTTNTTYINSKIRQRVRLVNAQETAISETGSLGSELPVLRNDATVASLREQYKADLVAMISNSSDNCGIGYLMGSANPLNGFTVTSRTCAVGNLSFPHELGHNMGSQHNPESGSGATYPYGYGHYVDGIFRTVMSYVDPCPNGCTRRPYFSNPEILFNGLPTGIDNARDNARSINNTADTIANYRYSGSNLMMNNFNGGEALPRNIARNLSWSSDNVTGNVRIEISRDESTNWQTLIANTPNDGTENVTVYGRSTRRARLRIVSINNPTVSDSSVRNISIR